MRSQSPVSDTVISIDFLASSWLPAAARRRPDAGPWKTTSTFGAAALVIDGARRSLQASGSSLPHRVTSLIPFIGGTQLTADSGDTSDS